MIRAWVLSASGILASTGSAPVLAADPGFYLSAGIGRAEYLRSGDSSATLFSGETAAESVLLRLRYKF